ncbi:MAG: hypothetical protein ACXWEE_05940, partial [Thermoleophilaceae bacterium]
MGCAGGREYCLRREQRVVVELDGAAAHDTSRAFERDRERDAAGSCRLSLLRYTWRRLTRHPEA